jgi:hypothetical protein
MERSENTGRNNSEARSRMPRELPLLSFERYSSSDAIPRDIGRLDAVVKGFRIGTVEFLGGPA